MITIELLLDEDELTLYRDDIAQVVFQHMQLDSMYFEFKESGKFRYRDRKELKELLSNLEGNRDTLLYYQSELNKILAKYPSLEFDLGDRIKEVKQCITEEVSHISALKKCWFM